MGKSTKMASTGSGIAIEAGYNLAVTQFLVHDPLGTIGYIWPIHWACHFNLSEAAYKRMIAVHEQVAKIEPGSNNTRLIGDEALLMEAYDSGTSMVSNAVRAVRHLVQQMMAERSEQVTSTRVIDALREVTTSLKIDCRMSNPGYNGLSELVRVRDAIEHPTTANVYQNDSAWDRVPLAWLLSERSLKSYENFRHWLDLIIQDWESLQASNARQVELTVERGVKSNYPAKKPR
jgi:hypothetical protein